MSNKADLIAMLEDMLRDPSKLAIAIPRFQSLVWENPRATDEMSEGDAEVLRDLAYDLDYFVADPQSRAEDPSYFGPDRALADVREALQRLGRTNGV